MVTTHEKESSISLRWMNDFSFVAGGTFLFLIGTVFHSCGFYLLLKIKKIQTGNMASYTNKKLLVLLSCSELLYGLFVAITNTSILSGKKSDDLEVIIPGSIAMISWGISISATFLITSNRLLSTVYPLWYRATITKKKFVVVVVSVTVVVTTISTICSLVYFQIIATSSNSIVISRVFMVIFLNLFLIFCIFTYIVILISIVNSQRNSQFSSGEDHNSTSLFQLTYNFIKTHGYATPFLLTFTFIIFICVPNIVDIVCIVIKCSTREYVSKIAISTFPLNNISDAVIYVLLDRDIRMYLKMKVRRSITTYENENDNNVTPTPQAETGV